MRSWHFQPYCCNYNSGSLWSMHWWQVLRPHRPYSREWFMRSGLLLLLWFFKRHSNCKSHIPWHNLSCDNFRTLSSRLLLSCRYTDTYCLRYRVLPKLRRCISTFSMHTMSGRFLLQSNWTCVTLRLMLGWLLLPRELNCSYLECMPTRLLLSSWISNSTTLPWRHLHKRNGIVNVHSLFSR